MDDGRFELASKSARSAKSSKAGKRPTPPVIVRLPLKGTAGGKASPCSEGVLALTANEVAMRTGNCGLTYQRAFTEEADSYP